MSRGAPPKKTALGLWWLVQRLLVVMTLAIVAHVMLATWHWPDGPVHIRDMLAQDLHYLAAVRGTEESAANVATLLYDSVFEKTGFNNWMRRFASPQMMNIPDTQSRRLAVAWWPQIVAFMYALQLFGVRLTILVLSLPSFALFAVVGATDGWVSRYLRRAHGGRESGFLYGRFKRGLFWSPVLCWGIYLMLPMSIDPRWIVIPSAILFGLSAYGIVAFFKKYW